MSILGSVFLDLIRSNRIQNTNELADLLELASARLKAGDDAGAAELCSKVLKASPQDARALVLSLQIQAKSHDQIAASNFPGPNYLMWLEWFHQTMKPATYLEIGVAFGDSLKFARPPTRAIGVDPDLKVIRSQETWVKLFKLTSDDFFAQHTQADVFGGGVVELAFIDGLHTFDQALKDFINIERAADARSIVVFHDIFPVVPLTAARDRQSIFWVGDTWKVMPILRRYRPDLKILTIPTFPSGLGIVTNLNPDSGLLMRDYKSIVEQALTWDLETRVPPLAEDLNVVANDFGSVAHMLGLA